MCWEGLLLVWLLYLLPLLVLKLLLAAPALKCCMKCWRQTTAGHVSNTA
jgi:hypothetical protein